MRLYRTKAIAAAALALASLAPAGFAAAADLPVKAVKAVPDAPFFFVIDDRVTYSWMPKGTDPGAFSVRPDGSINGTTAKSVYSFTHFDAWAYGTNFFTISLFKSDHNDPANPCTNAGIIQGPLFVGGTAARTAPGADRNFYGFGAQHVRLELELFNTHTFTMAARCITSRSRSAPNANTENNYLGAGKARFRRRSAVRV